MFDRFIRFAARQAPHELAVSNGLSHSTYRHFDTDVDKLAKALDAEGLRPGALTGICVADPYFHLLLTMACARLRVATASIVPEMAAATAALTGVDTIVTADTNLTFGGLVLKRIAADVPWLQSALAATDAGAWISAEVDPEALGRVQLSSGTTGTPKAVGLSWRLINDRVLHIVTSTHRLLSLIGPESGAIQMFLACWAQKGCVLFAPSDVAALASAFPALAPEVLLASPTQLSALIAALPADAAARPILQVGVAGGYASPALLRNVRERLGRVTIAYASTEAGVCAWMENPQTLRPDAVGWAMPWCDLQVVREDDTLCPINERGRLRVRGAELADGYVNDPALTAERFKNGWFYPGDLASLDADGLLSIHGREDEVMNFGGVKFLPETLEASVRLLPGVTDVAAFALEDVDGQLQPWLAIVRDEGFDETSVGSALRMPGLPPVRIAWIDALPRTLLGKVKRDDLKAAARPLQAAMAR